MPFSGILYEFKTCFGLLSRKIAGTFAITLRFLTSRHKVFRFWFHACNLLCVTSPQKHVTDVSLVLKDNDIGFQVKIHFFQNMIMLHIKLNGITNATT